MNRKILALGIVITLIAGFVACKALTKTTENTATSEPTVQAEIVTDVETEDATQQEETHYDFDAYVAQYESDNNLTDEQIAADEALKVGMFEWMQDAGVEAGLAVNDQYAGCTNIFLNDYIQWLGKQQGVHEEPAYVEPATEDKVGSFGIEKPQSSDFFDEDGNFDKEGYLKAIDEYKKKVGEASSAHTEKVVEELGGETLTGEALDEWNREGEEFGKKAAEAIESGRVDAILDKAHSRLNGAG